MARKRNAFLDEADLDSSSNSSDDQVEFDDPELRAEHELFDDPYHSKRNKRRKTHKKSKADDIYGVFASQDDGLASSQGPNKRFQRPQTFVPASSSTSAPPKSGNPSDENSEGSKRESTEDDDESQDSNDSSGESTDSDGDSSTEDLPNEPSVNNPTETPDSSLPPARYGLGARSGLGSGLQSASSGLRSKSHGLGFSKASNTLSASESDKVGAQSKADPEKDESAGPRRSFLGAQELNPIVQSIKKKPLSRAEQQHFAKLERDKTASIGLKMLEKMGWKSGTGLGAQGEGIVTPLETKARPKGMGLSYKGFQERTDQAKEEDRRNGKLVDDPERPSKSKSKPSQSQAKREAWKTKPKKAPKPPKLVHRTYEEIILDLANDPDHAGLDPGVGEIIDLTGQKLPSLNTTLLHHSKGPTEEERNQRLPELMHNLALICDMAKGNLINLAKEGRHIKEKQDEASKDLNRAQQNVKIQQRKLTNMKKIVEISQKTKSILLEVVNLINAEMSAKVMCQLIERFDGPFDELSQILNQEEQSDCHPLDPDEIVVCGLAPILRKVWAKWDILDEPQLSVQELKRYKSILQTASDRSQKHQTESDVFHHPLFPHLQSRSDPTSANRRMVAYESLIWNDWLPRVRTTVNMWSAYRCEDMIRFYSCWKPILPQFVHDNLLDQLIVPKLISSIARWDFREQSEDEKVPGSTRSNSNRISLHLFVFPWLEHLGPFRSDLLLSEVKLKLSEWMKAWKFSSLEGSEELEMIEDLLVWKQDVIKRSHWDKLILKTLIPKLAAYLRSNLVINPKQQDLGPIRVMIRWIRLISNRDILDELLSVDFFKKWLETLWIWLKSPTANDGQIVEWMNWWKAILPDWISERTLVIEKGFGRAQELISEARCLRSVEEDLEKKLMKPDLTRYPLINKTRKDKNSKNILSNQKPKRLDQEIITFRSIVEEEAIKANLILINLGKSLESKGKSLYKLCSENQPKKKGLIISIEEDVIFVKNDEDWEPMLVEDVLEKARSELES